MLKIYNNLTGTKWGDLPRYARCHFFSNCNYYQADKNNRDCILDLTPILSISARLGADETEERYIVDNNSEIYNSTYDFEENNIYCNLTMSDAEGRIELDTIEFDANTILDEIKDRGLELNMLYARLVSFKYKDKDINGEEKEKHNPHFNVDIKIRDDNHIDIKIEDFDIVDLEMLFRILDTEGIYRNIFIVRTIESADYFN